VAEIRSQLHKLISDQVTDILSGPNPLANDITRGIIAVQGESTDVPSATFFELNGIKSLSVAYVILQGGDVIADTQPYLEFYSLVNGNWELITEAPTRSDFRGCTFFISPMQSSLASEAWFLV
jgi:hypothetical protein